MTSLFCPPISDECRTSPTAHIANPEAVGHQPEVISQVGEGRHSLTAEVREAAIQRAIRQVNVHAQGRAMAIREYARTGKQVYAKAADLHCVMGEEAARLAAELIAGRTE